MMQHFNFVKYIFCPHIWLFLFYSSFCFASAKPAQNLQSYGFSENVERYRQRLTHELNLGSSSPSNAMVVPEPILPKLETNYSDLVPPPTEPVARRYYQPRFESHVPDTKEEFLRDREERLRDYSRPPDFNVFLGAHKYRAEKIYASTIYGLSGLYKTIDADVLPRDYRILYAGVDYTKYNRSFGTKVNDGNITKYAIPLGVAASIYDNFEVSLGVNAVNEKSFNFPFVQDYEKTELEEISFMGKYKWFDNPSYGLKSAFGFGVLSASGKQVTRRGNDGTSYTGFMSLSKDWEKFRGLGQLGVNFASGKDATGNEAPNSFYYNMGFESPVSRYTRAILEIQGIHWSGYSNNLDICFGARYKLRDELNMELFVPVNIFKSSSRVPTDYDYTFHIGMNLKI